MTRDFLPKFRRQLFDWLQLRLADGRTPFRRAEEQPPVETGAEALAAPDLVLWINRDSLLAGAMILVPAHANPSPLAEGGLIANSLGLRQFATWEARAVNLWETATPAPTLLKSWPIPAPGLVSAADFTAVFEQLLQELGRQAVRAGLPAEQLPAAYFANLCRQVLRDIEPALLAAARVTASTGETDVHTLRRAHDKGWLALWRLLALLGHDRLPPGVRPERLERAIAYALTDLDRELATHLVPGDGEPPLPESAAVRLHHLAGRLGQLGWPREPQRARDSLLLLLAAAGRDSQIATGPLHPPPDTETLLVNHLPPQPLAGSAVVAPQAVLAGLALTTTPCSSHLATRVAALPADCRPRRIVAELADLQPPPPGERRKRQAALRHPWPYRRFGLAASAPAWLWEALHLAGMAGPEGVLQLTLPADWAAARDATLLWQTLSERLALAELALHADGRQTLTLVDQERAPEFLEIREPDGSARRLPALLEDAPLAAVAALGGETAPAPAVRPLRGRSRTLLAEEIAARVFRDGVPDFPDHYLRRADLPPLRTYRLPGPLQPAASFFGSVRLAGPGGTFVDADDPAAAEALLLAARNGREQVALPIDPALTTRLTAAYRHDLQGLWQTLLDECRRQLPAQHQALTLARRLWHERDLPEPEPGS